jgi:hypothetical protein
MTMQTINLTPVAVIPQRGRGRPRIEDSRLFVELTREEQIERWERVRHVLRNLSKHQIEKHFDMSDWLRKTPCGTIGCAAGQCALDPWFNRRGFRAIWSRSEVPDFTIEPDDFFGQDGYRLVFVDRNSMKYFDAVECEWVERKPSAQHRITLRNVNQYLKSLKAQA